MIPDATVWIAIAGLGLATYAIRFSFLGLLGGRPVPRALRRALAFVPVTVLPALIAPMVLVSRETGGFTDDLPGLAAALAALAVGMLTRNLLAGILAGAGGYALAGLGL